MQREYPKYNIYSLKNHNRCINLYDLCCTEISVFILFEVKENYKVCLRCLSPLKISCQPVKRH